jgi:hypothetical protein
MSGAEVNGSHVGWCADKLVWESRTRWNRFKPQYPRRKVHRDIDPQTNLKRVTLIYKAPNVMRKIPLMPMPQHFSADFIFWYYDWRKAEAVIVLRDGKDKYKHVHVFDPMWLINCTFEDIIMLFYNTIYYEPNDFAQARKYTQVVGVCFAYDINAGSNLEGKLGKTVKIANVSKPVKKTFEPPMTTEQKKQLRIKLMNKTMDQQRKLSNQ